VIPRWHQGRAEVEALIAQGHIEKVRADRALADLMLAEAVRHLSSSRLTATSDPTGSFAMAYDACRKALAAVLENQGLRATTKGGHKAVEEAVRAQLVPPKKAELDGFGWMRILRNNTQYPSLEKPLADLDDTLLAQGFAEDIIEMAQKVLDHMPAY